VPTKYGSIKFEKGMVSATHRPVYSSFDAQLIEVDELAKKEIEDSIISKFN